MKLAVACAAVVTFAGCASVKPVPYSGLRSAPDMTQNKGADARHIPYEYTSHTTWSRYTQVVIEPVEIYTGIDAQFADVNGEDQRSLADYMGNTFSKKLAKRFEVVDVPSPSALRVKLTLTGAKKTTMFLGQFSHIDIGGNLYNGVQAVSGGRSAFGGFVTYAVEIYDSKTNKLLEAYVSDQYPNAMNFPAAFGALGAAKTGLDKGADALVSQLQ